MARTVHTPAHRVALRAATSGSVAGLQAGPAAVRPWRQAMAQANVAIIAASKNEAES